MAVVGNVYDNSGWYTPKKYGDRPGSAWAVGKNSRPDNYSKSELQHHYDLAYNDPVSKMRPDKALPDDADSICYDWVMNIRSGEGRWQIHNPNGLNADRVGLDPYDWEDSPKISGKTRAYSAPIEEQNFNAAFEAARSASQTVAAAAPRAAAGVTDPSASLSLDNINRNSLLQSQFKQLATQGAIKSLTYGTILSLGSDEEEKNKAQQSAAV